MAIVVLLLISLWSLCVLHVPLFLFFFIIIISCGTWNCCAQTKDCFDGNVRVFKKAWRKKVFAILLQCKKLCFPARKRSNIGSSRSFFPCRRLKCNAYLLSSGSNNANFFQRVMNSSLETTSAHAA